MTDKPQITNASKALLKKNLIAKETHKRKCNQACWHCGADILIGDHYMSVRYNDGFVQKFHGAYHIDCWKAFINTAT